MVRRNGFPTVDDPEFSAVARWIAPPPRDPQRAAQFFPAYASLEIGEGLTVDISHFYSNASHPRRRSDRPR